MKFAPAILLGLAFAGPASAATPSIEDFVRHPTYSGAKISPDGEYIAVAADRGEQDVLTILRTKDLGIVKFVQLPNKQSVAQFYWTSRERLIFTATEKFGTYTVPMSTGEWFAVNVDGTMPRRIISYDTKGIADRGRIAEGYYALSDTLRDDDENVLMELYSGERTEMVLVDTTSGRQKKIARAPRDNCSFALDAKKQPTFAVCSDVKDDASDALEDHTQLYQRSADGTWTLLNSSKASGTSLSVLGSAPDGRIYAYQSDRKGPRAFGTIDTRTGAFTRLFHDPVSEPADLITSVDGETVLGVVTEAGAPKITMIDETHPDAELYATLSASFPGQLVSFGGGTQDGRRVIVSVSSDRNPGELYLFDRDSGKARFLMQNRAWIDAKQMATVKPFSLTTRDGLKIYGYLTLPNGSNGRNLPLIVNPHGGPMGPRDNWGFNWETQLLASRGYAVLQVNYRGSGGFGKAFQDMAYGQWATGIMNDIVDATRWAIDKGHADPNRICIYGGSFGGYASLMAPAREPGLFKCAFGYVGMYDASIQMRLSDTSKSESGMRYLNRAFGPTRAEQEAMSPITHAAKITLPVYLAAGARDARCPPEHTEAMYKALAAAGNKPEGMIIQSKEMHGFYDVENRKKLYTAMLDFFDRHIGKPSQGVAASN